VDVHVEPFWSPEPIAAMRLNKVVRTPSGDLALGSISRPERYGRHVTARCHRRMAPCRVAPGPRCSCGMWACPSRDRLFDAVGDTLGCALVHVALSGVVVEHELSNGRVGGWRAQHLEVLSVSLPASCWCAAPATTFAVPPRLMGPTSQLLAWCDACAARLEVGHQVSHRELAEHLEVPVLVDADRRLGPTAAQRELLATWWR